jgi:hypothetical protein
MARLAPCYGLLQFEGEKDFSEHGLRLTDFVRLYSLFWDSDHVRS